MWRGPAVVKNITQSWYSEINMESTNLIVYSWKWYKWGIFFVKMKQRFPMTQSLNWWFWLFWTDQSACDTNISMAKRMFIIIVGQHPSECWFTQTLAVLLKCSFFTLRYLTPFRYICPKLTGQEDKIQILNKNITFVLCPCTLSSDDMLTNIISLFESQQQAGCVFFAVNPQPNLTQLCCYPTFIMFLSACPIMSMICLPSTLFISLSWYPIPHS